MGPNHFKDMSDIIISYGKVKTQRPNLFACPSCLGINSLVSRYRLPRGCQEDQELAVLERQCDGEFTVIHFLGLHLVIDSLRCGS